MYTTYTKFAKSNYTWQMPKLNSTITLSKLDSLPNNIFLHLFDNIVFRDKVLLVPDPNNILLNKINGKKYLYHVTDLINNTEDPINTKGIIASKTGLFQDILTFKQTYKNDYKYPLSIDDIPTRNDVIGIISHNSMFRVKVSGQLATVRRFNYIFHNLINIIKQYPDRVHYVHIPMETISYNRSDFINTFKGYNKSSIRYQESYQYLFVMHLLGFIEGIEDSIFTKLTEEELAKVIVIPTCQDKCVFYQLSDLIRFNKKTSIYLKVINNINQVTAKTIVDQVQVDIVKDELVNIPTDAVHNSPAFTELLTPEITQQAAIDFVTDVDTEVIASIDKNEDLTPAQKTRVKRIATAYKSIDMGGVSIEDILTKNVDNELKSNNLDFLKDEIDDLSMLDSSIISFDKQYMEKTFKKNLISSLVAFNKQGMFLTAIKETTEKSELNHLTHYNVKFEDVRGVSHSLKFTLPGVDKNGNCLLNGSLKSMKKQRINLPICKVSPTRVTLSSNYTKSMVERNTNVAHNFISYLSKLITKYTQDIVASYSTSKLPEGVILPYEYSTIGAKYSSLTIGKNMIFNFEYNNRYNNLHKSILSHVKELEFQHGIYLGKDTSTNLLYFMDNTCALTSVHHISKKTNSTTLLSEIAKLTNISLKPINEYVEIKIQNKKVPVIFLLSYRYGLTHMLDYLNTKYTIYDKGTRIPIDPNDIKIVFQDKTLIVHRVPIINSLLFSGLNFFDLKSFDMEDMDEQETYHEIAVDKNYNFNFIRGIDNFFDLFVDPITRDILLQMKEPTNVKDLLIRSTTLLTTEDHKPTSSSSNFRYRSYEKMAGIIYNELSRSLVAHKGNTIGVNNKFSVNPFIIKQRILKDQLFANVDIVNPIHDIKKTTAFSHMGEGGRSADTFMIDDRKFPVDGMGIMSEANIDSGTVAVNGYLSMNPTIVNTMGLTISKDINDIEPTELLSIAALTVPCVTNDDK